MSRATARTRERCGASSSNSATSAQHSSPWANTSGCSPPPSTSTPTRARSTSPMLENASLAESLASLPEAHESRVQELAQKDALLATRLCPSESHLASSYDRAHACLGPCGIARRLRSAGYRQ